MKFRYYFIDKLDLKDLGKNIVLVNLSIYHAWKNVKTIYIKHKFKILPLTWNDEFDLLGRSYSLPDIHEVRDCRRLFTRRNIH